jgi:hypothetical protein
VFSNGLVCRINCKFWKSASSKIINRTLQQPFDEYRHGTQGQNRDRKNRKKGVKGGIEMGQIWDKFFLKGRIPGDAEKEKGIS